MTTFGDTRTNTAHVVDLAHRIDDVLEHYRRTFLAYQRGGFPSDSMPEHVSGTSEPPMLALDAADRALRERDELVGRAMRRAREALADAYGAIVGTIAVVPPVPDPTPRPCGNPRCPDQKTFRMIGNDRPKDGAGRCAACHAYVKRKGVERTEHRRTT